jgi:hypothetical protein
MSTTNTTVIAITLKFEYALPSTVGVPFSGIIDDPDQNTTTLIDSL